MVVKKTIRFDFELAERNLIDDFREFIDSLDEDEFNAILEVTKGQNFIDSVVTLWNLAYDDNIYCIGDNADDEELDC